MEVEEIIHQLVQNILQRFFKDDASNNFKGHSIFTNAENLEEVNNENCHSIDTSRDYLAKLLFWYVVDFTTPSSFKFIMYNLLLHVYNFATFPSHCTWISSNESE